MDGSRPPPVGDRPGPEYDWLCADCAANPVSADQSLQMFCVNCIRELRRKYDPTFKE
jgi:hypothetical protein